MHLVLLLLGLLVILPMVYLAGCRLWVMVLARDSIQGSDLHMLRWCITEDTRAWGGFHLSFDNSVPFSEIKAAVRENISADMARPDSAFRWGVDLQTRRYVVYDDLKASDIIDETDLDEQFFCLKDRRKRELVYRFHNSRALLGVLFDHTVWDGIRIFNTTVTPAVQSTPFDSRWLFPARYTPVVSELMILYACVVMGARWATHRPMATLEDDRQQHVLRHTIPIEAVRTLKGQAECKFTAALVALWAARLFPALTGPRRRIRFGLIIGMTNPRFHNNYSILTLDIDRSDDVVEMARQVGQQMRRRAVEVLPLYDLLSIVEIQTMFKSQMVDVLFSPAAFSRGTGPSRHIRDVFLYIVPTSMPMYCFACSLDDQVTISTTWNTQELSLDQLREDADEVYAVMGDGITPLTP